MQSIVYLCNLTARVFKSDLCNVQRIVTIVIIMSYYAFYCVGEQMHRSMFLPSINAIHMCQILVVNREAYAFAVQYIQVKSDCVK